MSPLLSVVGERYISFVLDETDKYAIFCLRNDLQASVAQASELLLEDFEEDGVKFSEITFDRANEVILHENQRLLSDRDRDRFLEILEETEPNQHLIDIMGHYKATKHG